MSGFQIPGLGNAKPNESLPPLPAEAVQAPPPSEPSESKDEPMNDATEASQDDTHITNTSDGNEPNKEAAKEEAPPALIPEPMTIDQDQGSADLTDALEAALNGLDVPKQQLPEAQNGVLLNAQSIAQEGQQTQTQTQPSAQNEVVELQNDVGENPEWEIDSSPYESSSESSSSDSSDEDSDNEGYELLGVEETARLLLEAEGGSDDEGGKDKGAATTQLRTKNEVLEEPIPKPDVTITPDAKIEELGSVEHILDTILLIKAITPGEYQVLDTGSVLCTSERVVIGAVAETIGKVLQPMYTVRFSSADEIKELGLEVGAKIFYSVDHASYVFTEPLKSLKGSDASNLHDEEVGADEMEFSDDEKEMEYKRSLKRKKESKRAAGGRGAHQPHPLRQEVQPDGGLKYDEDDDDGPYKPLARPANFGSGPVSTETYELPPRPGAQRGRRGDSRGRGSRGRGGRGGRGSHGQQPRDGYSLPPQGPPQHAPANPMPPNSWNGPANGAAPPGQGAPAGMPNFNFPFPAWPQQPGQAVPPPPPPPPGWSGAAQGQAPPANGAFVNPAFFAALMAQMQQQQQQQPPRGGQGQ
ncbi:hypothetical protein S40293_08506 [Stachybotrys chartarum IBT 40293]|nr:hypothetical protein S40293_08506 [Stachybotrys chartarum IBT 40293]